MTEDFEPDQPGRPAHGADAHGPADGPPPIPPGAQWWYGQAWGPPAPPQPLHPRPAHARWYVRPIGVAALVAATVAAGTGIGHALWPAAGSRSAAASSQGSSSGGSGSANPFSGGGATNPFSGSGSPSGGSSGNSSSRGAPSDVSSIAAKVDPALVDINVTFDGESPGAGTGIVLTSNGEVLTNNHVVEGATQISVTDVGNGKTYGATVVGYDSTHDVAVIQLVHASGLQAAKIGNSSDVSVGDAVVAIGNAGGTGGTPSAAGGSITATNQAITAGDEVSGTSENLTGLIETNANVQPGDSGGSLVNSSGQVIGMDTAAAQGYSLSAQADQGYAIPIDKALSIASQIESGKASSTVHVGPTAYLGVMVSTSGSSSPYSGYYSPFNNQYGGPGTSGAVISGVVNGGPAAAAGLAQGDTITSLGGRGIDSAAALTAALQQYKPGDRVQLGWVDSSGTARTATVTLGSGPAQ